MKKILIILPFVLLLTAGCQAVNNNGTASTVGNNAATTNSTGQKFSDSADFANAYLISSGTLSSTTQQALTGFQLNKEPLPDGSLQINLKATESGYQDQQYTLKPGQQLYFVDRFLGDDVSSEGNQRDDYGVIVDSQGYIVK